jgi:hypothetical protein
MATTMPRRIALFIAAATVVKPSTNGEMISQIPKRKLIQLRPTVPEVPSRMAAETVPSPSLG